MNADKTESEFMDAIKPKIDEFVKTEIP